jgi:hypothetical protein
MTDYTPALPEVVEGTFHLHRDLTSSICQEFGGFIKVHSVVRGSKFKISQIKFRQGGLAAFLIATKEADNPAGLTIRNAIGSQNPDATTAVSVLGAILSSRINVWNENRENPLHYGLRLRSNNQLGVYLTLGVQDLEAFFQRGREMAPVWEARNAAARHVDAEAIAEELGRHG